MPVVGKIGVCSLRAIYDGKTYDGVTMVMKLSDGWELRPVVTVSDASIPVINVQYFQLSTDPMPTDANVGNAMFFYDTETFRFWNGAEWFEAWVDASLYNGKLFAITRRTIFAPNTYNVPMFAIRGATTQNWVFSPIIPNYEGVFIPITTRPASQCLRG